MMIVVLKIITKNYFKINTYWLAISVYSKSKFFDKIQYEINALI